jgi:hypothetical protein
MLRGHGWWLVLPVMLIGVPTALLAEKGLVSFVAAGEAQGAVFALIAPAIEYDSRLGLDPSVPYAMRVIALFLLMVFFWWLGRRLYSFMEPGTDIEREQP